MKGVVLVRKIVLKFSRFMLGLIPAVAMVIAVHSVSVTCGYILHQPDVPPALD